MSFASPLRLLAIGGSDSGGAAGIQADLKTFSALGAYGMSALTVVTAQDSRRIAAAHYLSPTLVSAQIDVVLNDYGADGIKTGFVGRSDLLQAIAAALAPFSHLPLLVDPVLVNHHGEGMFPPDTTVAYRRHLFPLATLITPNRREAEILSGLVVDGVDAGIVVAQHLRAIHSVPWLLKGIPDDDDLVDILHDGQITLFRAPRQQTNNTHGSGDTLSAGILTYLAQGDPLRQAIAAAHAFTQQAIRAAIPWQFTHGHGPLAHGGKGADTTIDS